MKKGASPRSRLQLTLQLGLSSLATANWKSGCSLQTPLLTTRLGPHSPLEDKLHCPCWKLDQKKKILISFPIFSPCFLFPSCMFSQVPRLLRKLILAWKLGASCAEAVVSAVLSAAFGDGGSPTRPPVSGARCPLTVSQVSPFSQLDVSRNECTWSYCI